MLYFMSPEEKDLLNKTYEIALENNKILRGMRRSAMFDRTLRLIYWIAVIGLSFGAFWYIQPYLQSLAGVYGDVSGGISNLKNISNILGN